MEDSGRNPAILRQELFELDAATDAIRDDVDATSQLALLAEQRAAVVARLQDLLPPGADIGFQRKADRDFDKAAFVDTPILIQGDGSEHG